MSPLSCTSLLKVKSFSIEKSSLRRTRSSGMSFVVALRIFIDLFSIGVILITIKNKSTTKKARNVSSL
jgi:hypothetical protein